MALRRGATRPEVRRRLSRITHRVSKAASRLGPTPITDGRHRALPDRSKSRRLSR
jgi:hypothetical protein